MCYLSGLRFSNKAVSDVRHFQIHPNQDPSRGCVPKFLEFCPCFYFLLSSFYVIDIETNGTNKTQYYLSKVKIGRQLTLGTEDVRQALV